MKSPWTDLFKLTQYDNPWIKVVENQVLNPKGNPGIYGVVHFKNIAVGVLPLDENYNTWLVGQYRYPLDLYSWEIPEGGCPKGTDPLETAKRELKEETGLEAKEWQQLQEVHLSNSVCDEYGVLFLARDLKQGFAEPEDTEELVVKKVPFEEVYQMVKRGEITDILSITAIFRVRLMILEGEI